MSASRDHDAESHLLGWPRVAGLALTHSYQHIIMASLPPILTLIQSDFGASYTQMGMLLSVSRLSGGVLQLPAGLAADRFGKKRVLLLGFGLLLLSVFFAGLAPTFLMLVMLQMMVGAADSAFHPTTYSMISQGARRETLARTMSIHSMAGFGGTYLAMTMIARMGTALGWRASLMLLPVPGLLLLLVLAAKFREPPAAPRASESRPGKSGLSGLFDGPLPLIFWSGMAGGIGTQGMIAFLPTFLHVVHGLSVVEAGDSAGLLLVGVGSMWIGGYMADRVDRIRLTAGGSVAAAVMMAVLALWTPQRAVLSALLVATGVSMYFTVPGYSALLSTYSTGATRGRLYGISFAGSAIGSSVGALLVGWAADLAGFQVAFLLLAGAPVVRAVLVTGLRRYDAWAAAQADG